MAPAYACRYLHGSDRSDYLVSTYPLRRVGTGLWLPDTAGMYGRLANDHVQISNCVVKALMFRRRSVSIDNFNRRANEAWVLPHFCCAGILLW